MAETVHLYLKSNSEDIQGESSQTSLGRENSIECLSFVDAVRTAREKGSGMATGRLSIADLRREWVRLDTILEPESDVAVRYDECYAVYLDLYEASKEQLHALARIAARTAT